MTAMHDAHVSPSRICALALRSSIAIANIYRELRSLNSLVVTLDA